MGSIGRASLLMVLAAAPHVVSAQSTTTRAVADTGWLNVPTCTIVSDTGRLQRTLPLDVLNRLEEMSSSAFVQAFLVQFVADSTAGNHRVSQCARKFLNTSATDVAVLRHSYPDVGGIVAALRTAETARLRTLALGDTIKTIGTLVARLQADASSANLEVLGKALASLKCNLPAKACDILGRATRTMDTTLLARHASEASAEQVRQASIALAAAETQVAANRSAIAADSTQLARLRSPSDSVLIDLQKRDSVWSAVLDSAQRSRKLIQATVDSARLLQQAADRHASDLVARLAAEMDTLRAAIDSAKRGGDSLATTAGTRLDGRVQAVVAAPPPQSPESQTSASASSSIVAQLTDFIIARAEREAVNAFIINAYEHAANEPLLAAAFPNTWRLMRGLGRRRDGRLDAVSVGRIPLTVWRATLATDFATLPVSVLQAGAVGLCGGAATTGDRAGGRLSVRGLDVCQRRIAVLRPLAGFTARLFEGDPIFDVLSDAESFVPSGGPQYPREWQRLAEGVSVVASLAKVYSVQGYAPSADPARHPYILTSRSLAQVSEPQRAAFERLLIVQAIKQRPDIPQKLDASGMIEAVTVGTRVLERIAARLASGDTTRASTALIVRTSFDALLTATNVATAFSASNADHWIDSTRTRWRDVADVVEPLVSRDFGLAFSRVTVLVGDLRTTEIPSSVITLTALAASLSEAKTGDQIRVAFENAATPVGGWQAKRYGEGGISINAFPGVIGGAETLIRHAGDPADVQALKGSAGVTLPVGIEWVRTNSQLAESPGCKLLICNFGVFIPLLDLGAPFTYRIGHPGAVQPDANATLAQVFAPGFFANLLLTRSVPLNFLAGAQLMPSLRNLTVTTAGTADRSVIRFGAALVMDLQLFKL